MMKICHLQYLLRCGIHQNVKWQPWKTWIQWDVQDLSSNQRKLLDAQLCTAAINALASSGLIDEAISVFNSMVSLIHLFRILIISHDCGEQCWPIYWLHMFRRAFRDPKGLLTCLCVYRWTISWSSAMQKLSGHHHIWNFIANIQNTSFKAYLARQTLSCTLQTRKHYLTK